MSARSWSGHASALLAMLLTAVGLAFLAAALAHWGLEESTVPAASPGVAADLQPDAEARSSQASSAAQRPAPPRGASAIPVPGMHRRSVALGLPHAGGLRHGVRLPVAGPAFFTWDPVRKRTRNRAWRRWGTDLLVKRTMRVLGDFAAAHPPAPRIGVGDLSRTHGGDFGPRFGSIGHASHQNGLDVDVYYPRLDRRERAARTVAQVDRRLSQDLVDRFVRAGAEKIFVGLRVRLRGPRQVVMPLAHHDNHLHVRFPNLRKP